jgi:hypothetical protein
LTAIRPGHKVFEQLDVTPQWPRAGSAKRLYAWQIGE